MSPLAQSLPGVGPLELPVARARRDDDAPEGQTPFGRVLDQASRDGGSSRSTARPARARSADERADGADAQAGPEAHATPTANPTGDPHSLSLQGRTARARKAGDQPALQDAFAATARYAAEPETARAQAGATTGVPLARSGTSGSAEPARPHGVATGKTAVAGNPAPDDAGRAAAAPGLQDPAEPGASACPEAGHPRAGEHALARAVDHPGIPRTSGSRSAAGATRGDESRTRPAGRGDESDPSRTAARSDASRQAGDRAKAVDGDFAGRRSDGDTMRRTARDAAHPPFSHQAMPPAARSADRSGGLESRAARTGAGQAPHASPVAGPGTAIPASLKDENTEAAPGTDRIETARPEAARDEAPRTARGEPAQLSPGAEQPSRIQRASAEADARATRGVSTPGSPADDSPGADSGVADAVGPGPSRDSHRAPDQVARGAARVDIPTLPGTGVERTAQADDDRTASGSLFDSTESGPRIEPAVATPAAGGPATTASMAANVRTIPIAVPIHSPVFTQELGGQLAIALRADLGQAELILSPADLGPVRVELSLDGNAARVVFAAQHAETRQALEQSLQDLRTLFAEQGLSLAAHVDTGPHHDIQQPSDFAADERQPTNGDAAPVADAATPRRAPRRADALIDLFA